MLAGLGLGLAILRGSDRPALEVRSNWLQGLVLLASGLGPISLGGAVQPALGLGSAGYGAQST